MSRKVKVAPQFARELDELVENLYNFTLSETSAVKLRQLIVSNGQSLGEHPNYGRKVSDVLKLDFDLPYYRLVVGRYLIFYWFDDENVELLHVMAGNRDYLKVLRKDFGL